MRQDTARNARYTMLQGRWDDSVWVRGMGGRGGLCRCDKKFFPLTDLRILGFLIVMEIGRRLSWEVLCIGMDLVWRIITLTNYFLCRFYEKWKIPVPCSFCFASVSDMKDFQERFCVDIVLHLQLTAKEAVEKLDFMFFLLLFLF